MWLTHAYVLLMMSCAPGAASAAECHTAEVPGFVSREACVASARAAVRTIVHALAVSGTDRRNAIDTSAPRYGARP